MNERFCFQSKTEAPESMQGYSEECVIRGASITQALSEDISDIVFSCDRLDSAVRQTVF